MRQEDQGQEDRGQEDRGQEQAVMSSRRSARCLVLQSMGRTQILMILRHTQNPRYTPVPMKACIPFL